MWRIIYPTSIYDNREFAVNWWKRKFIDLNDDLLSAKRNEIIVLILFIVSGCISLVALMVTWQSVVLSVLGWDLRGAFYMFILFVVITIGLAVYYFGFARKEWRELRQYIRRTEIKMNQFGVQCDENYNTFWTDYDPIINMLGRLSRAGVQEVNAWYDMSTDSIMISAEHNNMAGVFAIDRDIDLIQKDNNILDFTYLDDLPLT